MKDKTPEEIEEAEGRFRRYLEAVKRIAMDTENTEGGA